MTKSEERIFERLKELSELCSIWKKFSDEGLDPIVTQRSIIDLCVMIGSDVDNMIHGPFAAEDDYIYEHEKYRRREESKKEDGTFRVKWNGVGSMPVDYES